MDQFIKFISTIMLNQINNANDLVKKLTDIGDVVIYLLIAFAVVYIVWTTVMYFIRGQEDSAGRKEAGMRIFYGIVGLFVIVSIWGLVNILLNTFSTNTAVPTSHFPTASFTNTSSGSTYNPPTQGPGGAP